MQDSWLRKKADQIQSFADRKDMKNFLDARKTVYGPRALEPLHSLVLSADWTSLHTDKEAILKRWDGHFDGSLSAIIYQWWSYQQTTTGGM